MVCAVRPNTTFTNPQVSGFYFRPCRNEYDEVIPECFRCRCGTVRKQTNRNGYSNLMQDVLRQHPDHESAMLQATAAETGSVLNFVQHLSRNLYGWMHWIIEYSNLDTISEETLRLGMSGVTQAVERTIAEELSSHFGVMFDGVTYASEHYVAWFACFERHGELVTVLLGMAPLLNEPNDDLSARTHLEFLATMLPRDYGVQIEQCRFLVGDDCAVNRLLATLLIVPLVGCARHRLNRAAQHDLAQHEEDVAAVQTLMIKLRTLTQSAKLRLKTELSPVIRQDTRWGSTFVMLQRYLRLLEFLDAEDYDLMVVMPTPAANKRLRALFKELKDIESVSKALQGRDVDLLDVRQWFDGRIAVKPQYERFLGKFCCLVIPVYYY
ncbi:hypothetical protein PC110_g17151 [Phytophthora cactorum]|uniref:Uncharacterized protein n=1 Tax=Phytophthora cactorum TaxID=29920 RepID=A0A329RQG8_9STRA|nr:hypothetical protein PC110_g17151 [Phytophthora cactorum]